MTGLEPLYTADEMKAAEAGHDVDAMMERAGGAVAEIVARDYPGARVVAVCGKGANGGDGRIAAAKLGAEVVEVGAPLPEADVVIDAIFGTGFHGEPRQEAARSIEAIRSAGLPVVSVDVPSGVNASVSDRIFQSDLLLTGLAGSMLRYGPHRYVAELVAEVLPALSVYCSNWSVATAAVGVWALSPAGYPGYRLCWDL